jgi:hypothetical protein
MERRQRRSLAELARWEVDAGTVAPLRLDTDINLAHQTTIRKSFSPTLAAMASVGS